MKELLCSRKNFSRNPARMIAEYSQGNFIEDLIKEFEIIIKVILLISIHLPA